MGTVARMVAKKLCCPGCPTQRPFPFGASSMLPLATMPECARWATEWWVVSDFVNICLRSISQTFAINNPASGLLFVLAIWLEDGYAALFGLLGTASANLFAFYLSIHDFEDLRHGFYGCNAFLVGVALTRFHPGARESGAFVLAVVLFSVFSVAASLALRNFFVEFRRITLTLPFVLTSILFFLAAPLFSKLAVEDGEFNALGAVEAELIDSDPVAKGEAGELLAAALAWSRFMLPILRGISQVFFVKNAWSGCVILIGLFSYSATSALMALIGSVTAHAVASSLGADAAQLEAGVYSYDAVLASIAIGGVFFVATAWTLPVILLVSASCAVAHAAALSFWAVFGMIPVTHDAFVLVTMLFVFLQTSGAVLTETGDLTQVFTPEELKRHIQRMGFRAGRPYDSRAAEPSHPAPSASAHALVEKKRAQDHRRQLSRSFASLGRNGGVAPDGAIAAGLEQSPRFGARTRSAYGTLRAGFASSRAGSSRNVTGGSGGQAAGFFGTPRGSYRGAPRSRVVEASDPWSSQQKGGGVNFRQASSHLFDSPAPEPPPLLSIALNQQQSPENRDLARVADQVNAPPTPPLRIRMDAEDAAVRRQHQQEHFPRTGAAEVGSLRRLSSKRAAAAAAAASGSGGGGTSASRSNTLRSAKSAKSSKSRHRGSPTSSRRKRAQQQEHFPAQYNHHSPPFAGPGSPQHQIMAGADRRGDWAAASPPPLPPLPAPQAHSHGAYTGFANDAHLGHHGGTHFPMGALPRSEGSGMLYSGR